MGKHQLYFVPSVNYKMFGELKSRTKIAEGVKEYVKYERREWIFSIPAEAGFLFFYY